MRSPAVSLALPRVITGLWFLKASVTKVTIVLAGGRTGGPSLDRSFFGGARCRA